MNVLVIGSGGREHAIVKKLKESPRVEQLYALPGNGGMAADAVCLPGNVKDIPGLVRAAQECSADFVVVAPDDPLALGAVDALHAAGFRCFGPDAKAAEIESSKVFSKNLMRKYGIPIENVLRHYDVVSKRCPAMWVDDENAWFAFKRQVMEVMEMTKEELLSLKGTGDHPSDWALQAAQWAKENGIFTGDSAGNFGWQQPVTREAVAKLLYEYDQARNVDSGAADMVK